MKATKHHEPRSVLQRLAALALLTGGMALAAPTPSQVSVSVAADGTNTITTNSYNPATGQYAGQDSSTTNNIVRTNDTITYKFQLSLPPGTTKNTIVSKLPTGPNGEIYETWKSIPTGCITALSSISTDKLTLTCVVTDPTDSTPAVNFTAETNVLGNVPNGTVLAAPTTTITSTGYTSQSSTPVGNTSVTVTATPRYDLAKTVPTYTPDPSGTIGTNTNVYTTKNVPGPDGVTPGTLIGFPLILSANYGSAVSNMSLLKPEDELKGLSPLTQPITFTDDLSSIPGAVIYNQDGSWINPLKDSSNNPLVGGCVSTKAFTVSGVNPIINGTSTCTVTSNNPNGTSGTNPATGGAPTSPTVATISINGMTLNSANDNTNSRFITTANASGTITDARLELFDRVLLVWVPNTYPYKDPNGTSTNNTAAKPSYPNTYTNFTPSSSIDSQVNVQANTTNDTDYIKLYTTPPVMQGNSEKHFSTTNLNLGINKNTGNIRGSVASGTAITSTIRLQNNSTGSLDWQGINICDKIDNTTFNVNPDTTTGVEVTGVPGTLTTDITKITAPYVVGSTKYYIVQYSNTGVNGAIGWGTRVDNHSAAQATATCGDDQGPWSTDIAAVGGASAVTKVRVLTNYPLYSPANSYYGTNSIDATFNLKVVGTPTQPTLMDNWGTATSSTFTATSNPFGNAASGNYIAANGGIWASYGAANNVTTPYNSIMGDEAWIIPAKASIKKTIPKAVSNGTTIAPADSQTVSGGTLATFQLSPSLTLANATTTNTYPVTIIDTLPKYFTYVAGSASVTPNSIVSNGDGTTTITWTLPNITPTSTGTITPITFQATVDAITPDGSKLTNNAYISTDADPPSTIPAIRALTGSTYASSTFVNVSNITAIYPTKTVLTPYVAAKGVAQYQLSWYSMGNDATSNPQIIDILPYVGDGRGTTNTPVGLAGVPAAVTNDPSMVFYYTSATPSSIKSDPSDSSNALTAGAAISSGTTVWCMYDQIGTPAGSVAGCPTSLSTVTGIRGVSTLNPMTSGTQYSTTIKLNTSQTPVDGDIYANSLSVRGTGLQFLAVSNTVKATVRLFTISGTVFKDVNSNGIQNTGETGISGVTLTVTGTDSNGQAVTQTITTDTNGKYTFKDLPAGTYTVAETQPSNYTTTINTVGTFNNSTNGTLPTPATDAITNIVLSGNVNATAATGYNFGEIQNFNKPPLHKWVDNCGTKADFSKCPAPHVITDADSANSTALPGDILRYTLILDNRTNSVTLPMTFISDNVPANTTFLGATADVISTPADSGLPLISTDSVNLSVNPPVLPTTWNPCSAASSTTMTCSASGATHIDIGWNTDSNTTLSNADVIPAGSQYRVTFWVKVN